MITNLTEEIKQKVYTYFNKPVFDETEFFNSQHGTIRVTEVKQGYYIFIIDHVFKLKLEDLKVMADIFSSEDIEVHHEYCVDHIKNPRDCELWGVSLYIKKGEDDV